MIAPINYSIDVATPFQSALQGYQAGAAIRDDQAQQQMRAAALAQQQQMQQDLASFAAKPSHTGSDYAALMTKYPQLADHFKKSYDILNSDQQQNKLQQASQVYAAIQAGQPKVASQLLRDQSAAMRNSGREDDAKAADTMAQWIDLHPESAKTSTALMLASIMGPDKFASTFQTLSQDQREQEVQPAAVRKANADATDAEAKAKYSDAAAKANLDAVLEDINYKKQMSRIEAMKVSLSKQDNDLKRQELQLKIQQSEQDLKDKVNSRAADVETARGSIDNVLDTIDRIKKNPGLKDVVGSLEGSFLYPNTLAGAANPFSSGSDERADAIALIDSLGSQATLAQLPAMKGTGTITDKEEEILKNSLSNLSRKQSEDQFNANLNTVERLLMKARKNVEKRYGVQANVPDRPNVTVPGLPPGFKILGKE